MERIYEYDSNWSVYRTDLTNSMQLILVESGSGVVGILECWHNGSEYNHELIFKSDIYEHMKPYCDYILNKALKLVNAVPSKGAYASTYSQINDYTLEKCMLKERLKENISEEEREDILNEISECEVSIGECEGYLRELDYIDNGTQYW